MRKLSLLITFFVAFIGINCSVSSERYRIPDKVYEAHYAFSFIIVKNEAPASSETGVGVIVHETMISSFVLTAGHVCIPQGPTFIFDRVGHEYSATVIKSVKDSKNDLCLLETNEKMNFGPIDIASGLRWGDKVWALIASQGLYEPGTLFEPGFLQVLDGYFSGTNTKLNRQVFTDFLIRPGASGGPVFNENGELVSIIVSFAVEKFEISNGIIRSQLFPEIVYGEQLEEIKKFLEENLP